MAKPIPCHLKYVPVYHRDGALKMLMLFIEIIPLKNAYGEYWTHLEREDSSGEISSTTFDGFTIEGEKYIQCVGQFLILDKFPRKQYSFTFLLERHWKTQQRNQHRRIASLTCSVFLDESGHLSSVVPTVVSNLSVTVTRI